MHIGIRAVPISSRGRGPLFRRDRRQRYHATTSNSACLLVLLRVRGRRDDRGNERSTPSKPTSRAAEDRRARKQEAGRTKARKETIEEGLQFSLLPALALARCAFPASVLRAYDALPALLPKSILPCRCRCLYALVDGRFASAITMPQGVCTQPSACDTNVLLRDRSVVVTSMCPLPSLLSDVCPSLKLFRRKRLSSPCATLSFGREWTAAAALPLTGTARFPLHRAHCIARARRAVLTACLPASPSQSRMRCPRKVLEAQPGPSSGVRYNPLDLAQLDAAPSRSYMDTVEVIIHKR
jgi:hypothetical protein